MYACVIVVDHTSSIWEMCVSIVSLLPTDLLVRRQLWSVAALIIKLSSLPEISEMSQAC